MSQEAEFPVYVYNLPVDILQQICNSLDVDKGWQDLAAKCGYHFDKVQSFDLEYQRFHGSPTRRLIFDWGVTKNATIYDLHEKLKNICRVREMKLLEPLLIKAREHERRMAALRKAQEEARIAAASEAQGQTTPESNTKLPSSLQPQAANSPNITHSEAKEKKPSTQRSAVQDVQIQPDFQPDKHGYAKLNFDNNTENSRTKPTGKKKIAIPLETTRVYERCNQNERSDMERQKMNESKVENGARAGIPAEPSQSEVKGSNSDGQCKSIQSQLSMDLLLSEDEITSAMSLISLPAGQIDKDIAVAVSGTASFTYKELSQATDGFSDGNKLGEGAFGDVYLAVLKNSKCAVKKLKRVTDEPANRNAAEIKSLMRFRHENIVQLYGIAVDQGEICLVYQFMENGSLLDRLRCRGDSVPLSWEQRINILRGGACGIQYLHTMDEKCPLIHGDIKSSNILLDRHFEARVSDLGMAEYATGGQMTGMLTHVSRKDMNANTYSSRAYLPPDYFTNGPSTRSDTYGFGVIMLETCSGEEAYDERREGERFLAQYVTSLLEDQPEGEWPEQLIDKKAGPGTEQLQHLIKLALRCISHRKRDRPLMTETLKQLEWILDQWKKCSSQQVDSRAPLEMAESAWMNSQRKTSLPCQRVTTKPTPVLAKSQSLDAQPESLRLQKMYDQKQYQNNVKKLGAVLAEQPVENTQSASGQTSPAEFSQIDPMKMARLEEDVGNGSLDSDSIPTLTEENVSCFSDDRAQNQDPDHGSDNAELKAMNVFDNQGCDGSEMDEEYARRKLEEIECFDRNNMSPMSQVDSSPAKQSPSSSKATENVESTTDLHIPETGNKREGEYQTAQGNPGIEMVSFFSDYETAAAALHCDYSSQSQDQMVEGNTVNHVADGQIAQNPADLNQNEGGTTPNNGLLYCGISELNGQEVAILLDPATQQHYAVDPSTLDPLIYHQQQLQYYTQCQSGLESEDKMVASTGPDG